MRLFSKHKEVSRDTKVVLVFDIGSASVGGALVLIKKGSVPRVVYHARKDMVLQEDLDFDRFVSSMLESLEVVLRDLEHHGITHLTFTKQGDRQIQAAFVVYASPWYISQTKVLRMKRQKPFTLSKALIDGMVNKEKALFAESKSSMFADTDTKDAVAIECQVTDIRLEGYQVDNPYNKRTKNASFTVSMAIVSSGVHDYIEQHIRQFFSVENVLHHSFPFVATTSVRDVFSDSKDFVFVDVSGEVTDVSLVKGGALLDTASFPHGKYTVARDVASILNTSMADAFSQLKVFANSDLHTDAEAVVMEALVDTRKVWINGFAKSLEALGGVGAVPRRVFLTANTKIAPIFKEFIETVGMEQSARTSGSFDTVVVRNGFLLEHVAFRKQDVGDVFLGLEAFFVDKAVNSSHTLAHR